LARTDSASSGCKPGRYLTGLAFAPAINMPTDPRRYCPPISDRYSDDGNRCSTERLRSTCDEMVQPSSSCESDSRSSSRSAHRHRRWPNRRTGSTRSRDGRFSSGRRDDCVRNTRRCHFGWRSRMEDRTEAFCGTGHRAADRQPVGTRHRPNRLSGSVEVETTSLAPS
jgi:hypothetical protein